MDCEKGIELLPCEIDLAITSPPYNLGIDYDEYNDDLDMDVYTEKMLSIFTKLYKKTKSGGRVCVNVPPDIGRLKNNSKTSLDYLFHKILSDSGFLYRSKIVWHKKTITSRTAWGSFNSPSNPNILPSFEYILVFYKETPKKEGSKENVDLEKENFIKWTDGLWEISAESKKRIGHPAPYPVELCSRLIQMFSFKNDLVVDPFCGSGTTCVSAKLLDRKYVGFDLSENYISISKKRLDSVELQEMII